MELSQPPLIIAFELSEACRRSLLTELDDAVAPKRSAKLANKALGKRYVSSYGGRLAVFLGTPLFLISVFFSAAPLASAASLANRSALNLAVFSLTARASASY